MRVFIVEDHPVLAHTLALALGQEGVDARVATSTRVDDLVDEAACEEPDLVLLDLDLGPALGSGRDLVQPLRAVAGAVVVLTGQDDATARAECLEAGALAVLGKEQAFDRLVRTITGGLIPTDETDAARQEALALLRRTREEQRRRRAPFDGLSPREQEVLHELYLGRTPKEIAADRYLSVETVRSQIKSIQRKLRVNTQLAAVARARIEGWFAAQERRSA